MTLASHTVFWGSWCSFPQREQMTITGSFRAKPALVLASLLVVGEKGVVLESCADSSNALDVSCLNRFDGSARQEKKEGLMLALSGRSE